MNITYSREPVNPMRWVFLDLETYYNDEYSLKKMSVPEYVHHPLFEVIGCAVKEGINAPPYWIEGPELGCFLKQLAPSECALVSHNYLFDGYIISQKYNFVPKLNSCTLSISRATLAHKLKSLSLESVARHLGLGVKDKTALVQAKGMRLIDLRRNPHVYQRYTNYGCEDVEMCAGIFGKLVFTELPAEELAMLDMTLRCALQPTLRVNVNLLNSHLQEVVRKKEELLSAAGADKDELMSNDKLATVLRLLGVEPPKKISLTTGKETYAFAKTDVAFLDLLEHENPMVQAVVAARLGVKSTLEETRTTRFINIGKVAPESKMPIPLGYGNAHTHRLGGEWKLNLQNLPRGGDLRASLEAPEGYQIVKADASQIECRLTGWFCNCTALTQQFANGEDVYASFASRVWQRPIDKRTDPDERFIGKGAVLGLGFGMGWSKFQRTIKIQSENQLGKRISLSDAQSQNIVNIYRQTFYQIPETWRWLSDILPLLAYGGDPVQRGPLVFMKNKIILPSLAGKIGEGMTLKYHELTLQTDGQWMYKYGKEKKKLFGGKVMENIAQALDRIIVMGAALRLQKRIAPLRLALQAHDENVYVVPNAVVEVVKQILLQEMSRRPVWAPDLPLAAEVASGSNYRDLK